MFMYHYTPFSNWEKIKKYGLEPQIIDKPPEVVELFGLYNPEGIWLWKKKPNIRAHVGNIIYQVATKGETKIVQLRVKGIKPIDKLLSPEGYTIKITHRSSVERFCYTDGEESFICDRVIKPQDIELVDVYDLDERLS